MRVWSVLFILLILGIALFGEKGILKALQATKQKDELKTEVHQLEETQANLRREIDALRSDRRYIENIARKELGMVKEDELVYQFVPGKK
jgi:cell division protein FtsB